MKGYKIMNQNALHFITITTVGWIDVFARKEYREVLLESMHHCVANKHLVVYAYVIMSNHMHVIWQAPHGNLSNILRDFKKFTAHAIIQLIQKSNFESRRDWLLTVMSYHAKFNKNNCHHQFWAENSHAVELISPEFIKQKLDYIHYNPVRAGLVLEPAHFTYSSASTYSSGEGVFPITMLDIPLSNVGYVITD